MNPLELFSSWVGRWQGTNRLHDPNTNAPDDSEAKAEITSVARGKFFRLDYTWAYNGDPQEGSLLIGHDPETGEDTMHWIDTWHMGNKVMECRGHQDVGGFSVQGSYAAPPGPDWGWRIDLVRSDGGELELTMHNIWPDGHQEIAVEARYTRA